MLRTPITLQNGAALIWHKCCAIESANDLKLSFADLGIVRTEGKYGLIHIPEVDEPDDSIPLLPCTFDVLFSLYHPYNKSYFVGFKNGKCGLYVMTAYPHKNEEDSSWVCCTELAKPEFDSITWNGDNTITLHQGDFRQDYCLRTHTISALYECLW